MFRLMAGEEFREFEFDRPRKFRYAISNRGRLVSFTDNIREGRLLKGSSVEGYPAINYQNRQPGGAKNKYLLLHKIIAEKFLEKPTEEHKFVIHLDHDHAHNDISNLRWVTKEERLAHHKTSPHVIQARKNLIEHNLKSNGHKLSITQVIHLKKLINDPNRKTRLKILAKRFKISEMQLYRIKSGENWGHIQV
ncbi:MAG: HNH endonuclease [Flavobacterium sp.]|nr:HNH endonuclease [Flavobacterium sp.]